MNFLKGLLIVCLFVLQACDSKNSNQDTDGVNTGQEAPEEPAKDWLTVKTLVFDPACIRCHSAPVNRAGVNVETYQNVVKNLNRIDAAIKSGFMPLGGSLTALQKKLILEWIEAGAPEFF